MKKTIFFSVVVLFFSLKVSLIAWPMENFEEEQSNKSPQQHIAVENIVEQTRTEESKDLVEAEKELAEAEKKSIDCWKKVDKERPLILKGEVAGEITNLFFRSNSIFRKMKDYTFKNPALLSEIKKLSSNEEKKIFRTHYRDKINEAAENKQNSWNYHQEFSNELNEVQNKKEAIRKTANERNKFIATLAQEAAIKAAIAAYPSEEEKEEALIDQDLSLDGSPLLENPSVKQLRINWNIIFKTLEKISKSSSSQSSEKSTAIQHFYPKNDGFMDDPKMEYLTPGTIIMRYGGSDYSRFFTLYANDVPSSLLAPPPGTTNQIRKFKVKKPMHVLSGLIMPHFGEVGTWPQYVTPVKLKLLLEQGFLKECFEEGKPNSTEKSFSSECTNLDGEQAISKEAIKELEQDI